MSIIGLGIHKMTELLGAGGWDEALQNLYPHFYKVTLYGIFAVLYNKGSPRIVT